MQLLINKETGCVALEAIKDMATHAKGAVFGTPAKQAAMLISGGHAEPVAKDKLPTNVEFDTVEINVEKGILLGEPEANASEEGGEPATGDATIIVPADWQAMHHLAQMSLAKKIAGKDIGSKAEAHAIIEAHAAKSA